MKAHMTQAENPRQDALEPCPRKPEPGAAWLHIVQGSAAPSPLAARVPPPPKPEPPLSEDDWHLLFNAVTARLKNAVERPDTLAGVVPECIEALEWLQGRLGPQRHPRR